MRCALFGLWAVLTFVGVRLGSGLTTKRFDVSGWRRTSYLPKGDDNVGYTREQMESGAFNATRVAARVINGEREELLWKARYVASIWVSEDRAIFNFICTGSVVHKHIVLTAAHCVTEPVHYRVCVSSVSIFKGECFDVTDRRIPDEYLSSERFTHDISLLKVDGNLVEGSSKARIVEIDLARPDIKPNGQLGKVYGFGFNNERATQFDPFLYKGDATWKRFDNCVDAPDILGKNFVCTDGNFDGSLGGSCFGDSGGPLTWSKDGTDRPGKQVQVGVASFGYVDFELGIENCDVETPDAYTWTAAWQITIWLRTTIRDLGGRFSIYVAPS